ncbi:MULTISPECIES: mycofactocin-coupled SDR family oxidoreductase [unclassified Rhodococcus (in: high G+C Gram-positive bacteria)]|uniref:mycofactocin-coupled SDR family oxidoreductase n=1 Tax=unclassified Rhodococcus (in: high G+C Gram-positive bacteria) TaxID=192944 RepID=UPI000927579D|nr:mycofactocin-coupled SDR family oxidoreductase [Rhodococcus sp. M8]OLL19663.1 3-ketoacyl-ACP reductase [Rhodococcus sp. M8]QPG43497.1 mycofactocin-coupled SDR family oxidoreductase [Rhodococcus sp. M8]
MSRLEGKVALITGAARGQGRSHALGLAKEGADIIAIDIADQIGSVPYPMASLEDLKETARLVEELGRRVVTAQADVRNLQQMQAAVADGLAEFGKIDIVCANAGIISANKVLDLTEEQWNDMIDTNLTGVFHTVKAAVPNMVERGEGGSVIFTGSTSSLSGYPNVGHYVTAKHGIVGLMHTLANELGPKGIRVNAVHPTNVNTKLLQNETFYGLFRPDLEHPTLEDSRDAFATMHSLPNIPWVEPIDITNAIIFLASDESRYITGINLPIDAGASQKVGG